MATLRRKPKQPKNKQAYQALWKPEYSELAQYNTERSRGLLHTPEYQARMAAVQQEYDAAYLPAVHDLDIAQGESAPPGT